LLAFVRDRSGATSAQFALLLALLGAAVAIGAVALALVAASDN
jgi:Flp pilus assembly pilin Flp